MNLDDEIKAKERKMYIFLALAAIPIIVLFLYIDAIMKRTSPLIFVLIVLTVSYIFVYGFMRPAAEDAMRLKKQKAEEEKRS